MGRRRTYSRTSKVQDITKAVMEQLEEFSDEAAEKTKEAVDEIAKEAKAEIDRHITFNEPTGAYRKALAIKTVSEDRRSKKKVWYAKGKQARLPHLLEKGHVKRGGKGRVKAYPHIKYGDAYVEENLPKRIKEKIENAD